jgi:hypothetical protein
MSFEIPDLQTDIYKPPVTPDEEVEAAYSHIRHEIADQIANYLTGLRDTPRAEFRNLDFDGKMDKMCWALGQNPDTSQKSVQLKALAMMNGFGTYMYHGDHTQPRDYHLPLMDPYWSAVDRSLQELVQGLVDANSGSETAWPVHNDPNENGQIHTEYSWAVFGFSIEKRVTYSHGTAVHSVYSLSKQSNEPGKITPAVQV